MHLHQFSIVSSLARFMKTLIVFAQSSFVMNGQTEVQRDRQINREII
jgi:hypothetical protein